MNAATNKTATTELSFEELQQQIADLQKKASEVREREIAGVLEDVKKKISAYAITQEMLGFEPLRIVEYIQPEAPAAKVSNPVAHLYRHPENHDLTWTGRGRKPTWVEVWLAANAGKCKYDLLIDPSMRATLEAAEKERADKKAKKEADEKAAEEAAELAAAANAPKTDEKVEEKVPAAKAENIALADVKTIDIEPAVVSTKRKLFGM